MLAPAFMVGLLLACWQVVGFEKVMYRIAVDDEGSVQLKLVAKGHIPCANLETDGVYVIDSGFAIFLWVGKEASVLERIAVFISGQLYVNEHRRPACLPVTHYSEGHETHQFWRIFPDPPPLKDNSQISNNYDKYAMSYIDVDTNSCVTPSTAWERRIPKSLYAAHAWAMSEYLAANLGDQRLANVSFGALKEFISQSGACERTELDWARTKFALVVLTEVKGIDLTPLLNHSGPQMASRGLDDRYDPALGADEEDADQAREQAAETAKRLRETSMVVNKVAADARKRAEEASAAERADLHAELAALSATGSIADIKAADRAMKQMAQAAEAEAMREAEDQAIKKAEREARQRAAAAAAAQKRADEAAREAEKAAREARARAEETRKKAEDAARKVEKELRARVEAEERRKREEEEEEERQLAEQVAAHAVLINNRKMREEQEKLGRAMVHDEKGKLEQGWRDRRQRTQGAKEVST